MQERELVLVQAQDLLVLVEGLRVVQVRALGQVEDWVLALEQALGRVLELEQGPQQEALVEVLEPQERVQGLELAQEQGLLQELAQYPLVEF